MSAPTADTISLLVVLAIWPVWLVWEIYLLWRRRPGADDKPRTISMVMRDRAWHLSSLVYLWLGLASHYWLPIGAGSAFGGVAFWLIAVALVTQDALLWRHPVETWPRWLKVIRWPLAWMIIGALCGRFLFPQKGIHPWSD